MGLGDFLFNQADSPFRRVAKAATILLAIEAVAMPITFRHQLMDYVNIEAPKYERIIDSMAQSLFPKVTFPVNSAQPVPTFQSGSANTSTTTSPKR